MHRAKLVFPDVRHIASRAEFDEDGVIRADRVVILGEFTSEALGFHAYDGFHARIEACRPVEHFARDNVLSELPDVTAQSQVHGKLQEPAEAFRLAKALTARN